MTVEDTRSVAVAEISVEEGPSRGLRVFVDHFPATVGRGPEADVQLADDPADPTMSRRHVQVLLSGGRICVCDTSSNGTWIGETLLESGKPTPVGGGLTLWLGTRVRIRVTVVREPRPPAAASAPAEAASRPQPAPRGLIELNVLGTWRCRVNGREVPPETWESRRAIVLFVFLAERAGRPQRFDSIYEALWPDVAEVSRQALQATVSRARRALRTVLEPGAAEVIRGDHVAYVIPDAWNVTIDSSAFETAMEGDLTEDGLRAALGLYRGPFLEGHADEWVERRRTWLERRANDATERLGCSLERQGRLLEALVLYEALLQRQPAHEGAHAGVLRSLLGTGRRDEARRHYADCVRTLQRHVGAAPGAAIESLRRELFPET